MRNQFGIWLSPMILTVCCGSAYGDHIEELYVVDQRDRTRIELAESVRIAPDAATLLRSAPGGNVNGNGPLTAIPQYRGMYGSRISVSVNGAQLSSGGPNWMDPPLSYAPAAMLEVLEVYRGIAPVSAGQETIGGAIRATTWSGDFAESEQFRTDGRLSVGGQSVDEATLASAMATLANHHHRIKLAAMDERADDAEFPGGEIVPSEYRRQRFDLGYGYTRSGHTLQLDFAHNETDDSGTPALPMDIQYIDSELGSMSYAFQGRDWVVDARVFYSDIDHGMTNYLLRQAPAAMGAWRRNTATGDNEGFTLSTRLGDSGNFWKFGIDGFSESHNSDIDNPNNPTFFVVNFNEAEREVLGVFAERNQQISEHWRGEFGVRFNRVEMSSAEVNGTPALMMAPATMLRDTFNDAQRDQSDDNIDWVARLRYQAFQSLEFYAGLARKSRSPSYQERYLWLPLEATAGLADGRTYTGNIELDPEIAHEIELGVDYQSGAWSISPRLFYRDVNDFIQGTESTNSAAVMFVNMMNMMNGTNNAAPLEFNNVDATFYGLDVEWSYAFSERWSVNGLINYVRGERDDIDDNLYRIAPPNLRVGLNYLLKNWTLTVESVLVDEQNKVSETNAEQETAGYGLLNLNASWQISQALRLGAGIDNALDKQYRDHLAGYNRAANDDIAIGQRLRGYGRNAFVRVDYEW